MMAVDLTKIQQSSISSALHALHIQDAAELPGDQARQFFRHFLSDANTAALRASDFYKTLDWNDANALPGLCRFGPFRSLLSKAVNIPVEKLTFALSLEFLYKMAAAIWQQDLPALTYPTVILDSTTRQRFKDTFKNSEDLKSEDYPLGASACELIATLIDAYRLRGFQKLELNALSLNRQDPLGILENQPRFSHRMQQEITRFISAPLNAASNAIFYSAIVHGFVDAVPAGSTALTYTRSIAALVKDYLLTGRRPHEQAGTTWTSMQISVYEDASVRTEDGTDRVNPEDLLKSSPINYSDFKLHPFVPVSLSAFDDFLRRLDNLSSLYKQDVDRYWEPVSTDAGAKTIWVNHLKHYIETEARVRLADGSLTLYSYTLINRVLSQPTAASHVETYTCGFFDRSNGRVFPFNGAFVLKPNAAPEQRGALVVFTLETGAEEFESWSAFEQHLLAQMEDDEQCQKLLERLGRKSAAFVLELYTKQPARLGLKKTQVTSALIDHMVDDLLKQQLDDFLLHFDYAKRTSLHQGLDTFCSALDPCLASTLHNKHDSLIGLRQTRVLEQLPGKVLSEALALSMTPLNNDCSKSDLTASPFVFSEFNAAPLSDGACRDLMLKKLNSQGVISIVKGILNNLSPYLPADTPVTVALSALVLQRITEHRENLLGLAWQSPGSFRHNFYYFQQHTQTLPTPYTHAQADSAGLRLLGIHKKPQEQTHPYYSSRELTTAQGRSAALVSVLRDEIKATAAAVDVHALANYLNAGLLVNSMSAPIPPDKPPTVYSHFHEMLLDLPRLHQLGEVLMKHAPASAQTQPASASRALAVSVITDYLYPPSEQQPGYICGMNLNNVRSGEMSVNAVRDALAEHLKTRFPGSTDRASQIVVFTLLSARYAPELLVVNIPDALLYGQTLESVHFRHAVACMEATSPCSSNGLSYLDIATAYAKLEYTAFSESKKIAIALLKQLPALHFSMCQGVISETDIASVSHDDSLKAIAYITEQEALDAQTFTHLVQKPPRRKDMARTEFEKTHPGVDAERVIPFTEDELKKYFHVHPMLAADRHIGRRMRMTLLEKYMSCVSGVGFTEQELGLKPYPQGACSLQARFDAKFATYKESFLSGMTSRLVSALHGLPSLDRNRILNAYKYIRVWFKNSQNAWEESHFGLIALYKESESVQYAYEIFCPSGTIRPLPLTATSPTRINLTSSPPTADALWHESPYLYVPPLDEGAYLRGIPGQQHSAPYLMVSFYTVQRQTREMSREHKIQFLCQKMVDSVFSNIMELVYQGLKSPTAYEAHKERLFARAQLMASFVLPGYALYQDIKSGKVTLGTIITSALEIVSVLLPFVGIGIKALSISIRLGRVIILSKSLNFTKTAVTVAKAIQPLHSALPSVLLRSLNAANPVSALTLLFQIGHKGLLGLKYLLKFARTEMTGDTALFKGIQPRFLPPIDYRPVQSFDPGSLPSRSSQGSVAFFRPDTTATAGQLDIQQQMKLQSSHIDLSDVSAVEHVFSKNGAMYIYLQGNIFAVRKLPGDEHFQIYKNTHHGPYVTFNQSTHRWAITC